MSRNSVVLFACLVVLLATAPVFAQAPPLPGLAVTANTSHALLRGLQDWWRVVPQWYGGTTWRNLMSRNDLTLTGLTAAGTGWGTSSAPGSSGEMRFPGSGTNVYLESSSGMVGGATAFTILIGYRATTQAIQTLYREEGDINNAMRLYFRDSADNQIYFTMRDDVAGCCYIMEYAGGTPLDGVRHYIGVVQAAKDNRKLYLDGVEVANDNIAIGTPVLTARRLGNSFTGLSPLNGAIEEAFVYTRGLSAAEMVQLVQSAKQGHPTLLTRGVTPLSLLPTVGRAGSLLPFFLR